MKLITDHARWCGLCIKCLSADNPGVELFGRVLCLTCVNVIRDVLMAQVDADKTRGK